MTALDRFIPFLKVCQKSGELTTISFDFLNAAIEEMAALRKVAEAAKSSVELYEDNTLPFISKNTNLINALKELDKITKG